MTCLKKMTDSNSLSLLSCFLERKSDKSPLAQYSRNIYKLEVVLVTWSNLTMFGCIILVRIVISLLIWDCICSEFQTTSKLKNMDYMHGDCLDCNLFSRIISIIATIDGAKLSLTKNFVDNDELIYFFSFPIHK